MWLIPLCVKVNEGQWKTEVKYNGFKLILVECPVKNFDAESLGQGHSTWESKSAEVSK